jgi:hypothetical protein
LPEYQQTIPRRNSRIKRSRNAKGAQATAKSLQVAFSSPSNWKSSIVATTADMTAVMAKLHRKPSEVCINPLLVG